MEGILANILWPFRRFASWAGSPKIDPAIIAKESWDFWISKGLKPFQAAAWLGMEDGESSFRPDAIGDKGTAFGPFQHHAVRIDAMARPSPFGCGIDIRTASHPDQLRAAFWEAQHGIGYRHVWDHLNATSSLEAAVEVLVREYEQSAKPERDILRRTALAKNWAKRFGDNQNDSSGSPLA